MIEKLKKLQKQLDGELYFDKLMRVLYSTDASIYKEMPLAVAIPQHKTDVKKIIQFANENNCPIIPRAAGTSLAGQCVGNGLVVDIAKMNRILAINKEESWVRLEPGVIRDELNHELKKHGLFFGPNTSTANRCMMGGMLGNNSCGTTSIVYGSTRDHILEVEAILSDGSEVKFHAVDNNEFANKTKGDSLENYLYKNIQELLSPKEVQAEIIAQFPKKSIHRRNTGYAVDILLESNVFSEGGEDFNFCKLLAGSEGTLAFTTTMKLHVDPLPPKERVLVCPHFESIQESLEAVLLAMEFQPEACELMDKAILDCTKGNIQQEKNRFFIEGDPSAVLMIAFGAKTKAAVQQKADAMIAAMQKAGFGYSFPKVFPPKIKLAWKLRKTGLGGLSNIPGDAKPVACIEDTAVELADLPAYIGEFTKMMEGHQQEAIYYAHAGAGELHLRPILNLKSKKDIELLYQITSDTAHLVKKYNGSLSGEHGDGRLRAAFIPMMIGEKNYELLKKIKQAWDPKNIFNPGKIVDAPPMNTSLRYEAEQPDYQFETLFDFSESEGILKLAEKCNGSADCRRLDFSGGTMCPSYRATRNEKHSTRARANTLRELLSQNAKAANPFNQQEIYEVMELCLSCKGCTSECPSSVDMTTLKAEFLHQYYKSNRIPIRSKAFANINGLNRLGSVMPALSNFFLSNTFTSGLMKSFLNVAAQRTLPKIQKISLRKWYQRWRRKMPANQPNAIAKVYLFCDEFSNYNDTEIGKKAIILLSKLGYQVEMVAHPESGRASLSKGLLKNAQAFAKQNVAIFKNIIHKDSPLIGIEPSAILSFRDEYPKLVDASEVAAAKALSKHVFLIDEFLASEIEKGNIRSESFTKKTQKIYLHGHCHQKSLSSVDSSAWLMSLPENYSVQIIPSGCCGMAGSFGYEKEHYDISMQIGELVLFPAIRKTKENDIIAAPGTSCRHQIMDGTKRKALHPVEVLFDALKSS
ncbi:MAG TPA: FAD-binding oxidoreductase [Saprospiraceae bacterium]|nr:FAD-binding oxidoreductase [Saprospiraceae bacterium]